MMSAQRFSAGKHIRWQGTEYRVGALKDDDMLVLHELATAERSLYPIAELTRELFEGRLEFIVVEPEKSTPLSDALDLSSYTDHQMATARYRLSVIQPLLSLSRQERSLDAVRHYIASLQKNETNPEGKANKISVASVYRWMQAYVDSDEDIRSLIPNSTAQGGRNIVRLTEEANAIVNEVLQDLYLSRTSVTIDALVWEIARRIQATNTGRPANHHLRMPGRATVGRRMQALDVELKLEARKGKRAAKRLTTQYGEMTEPTVPLERVEIDSTLLDMLVVDPVDGLILGRPTLTFCVDVATRLPVGFSIGFEPPSYPTVMECMVQSIMPKTDLCRRYGTKHDWPIYGIPYLLVTDNGREFIGNDLADACQCLGIVLAHMPVRMPQFKGTIERLLGTIARMYVHSIPGTTFSNLKQKGDYDSAGQACVSLEDLEKTLCLYLVDVYSYRMHEGIGTTPFHKFQSLTKDGFAPRLPASKEDLMVLLGRTTTRKIQPYGIEFEGLTYNDAALSSLRLNADDKIVKVKYDPRDLSRIHVLDERDRAYVEVPAVAQNYTAGLSLWKHRVVRAFARSEYDKVDMAALGESMQRIREIVAESRARQKQTAGKRVGRWGGRSFEADVSPSAVPTQSDATAPDTATAQGDAGTETPDWLLAAEQEQWRVDYTLPTGTDRSSDNQKDVNDDR